MGESESRRSGIWPIVVAVISLLVLLGYQQLHLSRVAKQLDEARTHLEAASAGLDTVILGMALLQGTLSEARREIAVIDCTISAMDRDVAARMYRLDLNLIGLQRDLVQVDSVASARLSGLSSDPSRPQPIILDVDGDR